MLTQEIPAVLRACTPHNATILLPHLFRELPTSGSVMYLDVQEHPLLLPFEHHPDSSTGVGQIRVVAEILVVASLCMRDRITGKTKDIPIICCAIQEAPPESILPIGYN